MAHIPLNDGEEIHFIFNEDIEAHLSGLSATEQRDLLKKLYDIVSSSAPPDTFIHERIGNLDIVKFSKTGRIYCKIIPSIPEGDNEYHIVFVFYVDEDHDYDQGDLATYSRGAQQRMRQVTSLAKVSDVAQYLEDRNSITAEDLASLLDR